MKARSCLSRISRAKDLVRGFAGLAIACLWCLGRDTAAGNPVSVLTFHNDNSRQGVNTNETVLTLANVNANSFGKLFSYAVDGYVYTQPLIVTNVTVAGRGIHNVVYVATENNTAYAFDADNNSTTNATALWQVNLNGAGETTVPVADAGSTDVQPQIGITSTPVIDPASGTIYFEVKSKSVSGGNSHYLHRLHALSIATGAEKFGGPLLIADTINNGGNYTYVSGPSVTGSGDGSVSGTVNFNGLRQMNRTALGLLNGVVYLAYASHGDVGPYHGWLLGYNASNLSQRITLFNSTPNGGLGGFWQSGGGLTVDPSGNFFYLMTGNGSFDAMGGTFTTNNNFGMCVLKFALTNGPATLVDFFSPQDEATQNSADLDLSSGGPIVLPDSAGSTNHPHLLAAAGKNGTIYLLDRDHLGHFNLGGDQVVQEIPSAVGAMFATPAYWNNTLYYIGLNDTLKAFAITNAAIAPTPLKSINTFSNAFSGDKSSATPGISASGTSNAIVWALDTAAYAIGGPAILFAYNATNITQMLYNSDQLQARDNPGGAVKFAVPTVANGKVYVGTQFGLSVFGLATFTATPTISPESHVYTNSVTILLADDTPGAAIYYTLDGTTPTAKSTLYTGAFDLTFSAVLQVIALGPGLAPSEVAKVSFINSSGAAGNGTGLLGVYYSGHSPADPWVGQPILVRTDAFINFTFTGEPGPGVGTSGYTVRWLGSVQPRFNETYTFYTSSDDGANLLINGQPLVSSFTSGAETNQATIALNAQQLYNLEMDYYQNTRSASAKLEWSSPSTPRAVIPQSQLYPYSNPPPSVMLTGPSNNSSFTASASVTVSADADAPYNPLTQVAFYNNASILLGSVGNLPYALTVTGLAAGSYNLTAVATDGSGLNSTSAPVHVTVTTATGQPYGLAVRSNVPAFYNLPQTFNGSLPPLLSQTGVFTNTPAMAPATGLIPYQPNVPLWSDGALKIRYFSVPNNGGLITPDQQITFAPTGSWTFPSGTVFVKTFALQTNDTDPNSILRLETRLLVRDTGGRVYGVTYKWRPDNSEADLLNASLTQDVPILTAGGSRTQTWYYPSPADCLTCHTPTANYVLGVSSRQLNNSLAYAGTGVTDNELRALNHLGLFNPAFDDAAIAGYAKLSALTNLSASLQERARSYLDANCAQCHRPGGTGPTFDARYDTPLAAQNLTNYPATVSLGYDHAKIIMAKDIWRSMIYQRMSAVNPAIKMPPLARNLVDTNATTVMAAWINSLPGIAALAPPVITPNGGSFIASVNVSLQPPDTNAAIYYTLDGSLPTTGSSLYSGPLTLTGTALLSANAFETGSNSSVAASALFVIQPLSPTLTALGFSGDGLLQLGLAGTPGANYVLESTTNLINWTPLSTNTATTNLLNLSDPYAPSFPFRFYRVLQQ